MLQYAECCFFIDSAHSSDDGVTEVPRMLAARTEPWTEMRQQRERECVCVCVCVQLIKPSPASCGGGMASTCRRHWGHAPCKRAFTSFV